MSWITSQCSTTLPFCNRKMSTMARPGVPSPRVEWTCSGDLVAFGDDLLDLALLQRELRLQEVDEGLETFGAVLRGRVVLLVLRAEIRGGRGEILAVDRGVVERDRGLLVRFERRGAVRAPRRRQGTHRQHCADQGASQHRMGTGFSACQDSASGLGPADHTRGRFSRLVSGGPGAAARIRPAPTRRRPTSRSRAASASDGAAGRRRSRCPDTTSRARARD